MSKTQPASPQTARAKRRQASTVQFLTLAELDQVPKPPRLSVNPATLRDDAPDAIVLNQHLLSYEGCALDSEEFIWGLYGTTDQRDMRAKTHAAAERSRKLVLEIEGRYKLNDLGRARLGRDRETTLTTGYLHVDRLNAAFRDEMKFHLLQAASRRRAGFASDKHAKLSFGDLLLEHPWLLRDIFDMDDRIMMVVHRVRPVWNPRSRLGVQVCTMRRIAERIVAMKVLHLPGIAVRC